MSKLDPRIYKTLKSIDDALLSLLKKHPFSKITIEMLCKEALINRSTFYKYYADKYALLENYLDRKLGEFRSTVQTDFVQAEPATVGSEEYTDLFRSTMTYLYTNRELYQILWNAAIDRTVFQEMASIIRDCIMERTEHKAGREHYLELYATYFASNMMTLVHWWFENEPEITMDEAVSIMRSNMERGLFATFKRLI